MEIYVIDGQLRPAGAFKLVAVGYLLGAGVIFVPFFVLGSLLLVAAGAPMTVNGQVVEGAGGALAALLPMIMLPLVLGIQALMLGGLAVLGLWLYSKRRPIRVVQTSNAPDRVL